MYLLRGHKMDGDSAEVGYQGIAVDQWLGRVSDVESDALAGKADAYCKVDVARRQTGRVQRLLYRTAEDLALLTSGLERCSVVVSIIVGVDVIVRQICGWTAESRRTAPNRREDDVLRSSCDSRSGRPRPHTSNR